MQIRPLGVVGLLCRQLENPQPTTQWPCPLTVDSTTIEKDKAKPPASKPTNPTTTATSRPSSGNQGTRTTERRTSKSMMQCLQSTLKVRDQEPRRPEQRTTRSPRSVARRFMQSGTAKDRGGCSPPPLARSHSSLEASAEPFFDPERTFRRSYAPARRLTFGPPNRGNLQERKRSSHSPRCKSFRKQNFNVMKQLFKY